MLNGNPESATVSVYTEQGILIDLTLVKSILTLPTGAYKALLATPRKQEEY